MGISLDRDKILNAALIVFARQGFRKASLNDIVRPLGVAKTAIYHYFPGGKRQLMDELLQREEDIVLEKMRCAMAEHKDPRHKLRVLILTKIRYFRNLRELLNVPKDVGEEIASIYTNHEMSFHMEERKMIQSLLEYGQQEEMFRRIDRVRLAENIQLVLHRLAVVLIFEKDMEAMEKDIDGLLDILFHGIMNPEFDGAVEDIHE
jgi:TetR/AcrR family transcriptional repressor of lmrAB and yxaGH operons